MYFNGELNCFPAQIREEICHRHMSRMSIRGQQTSTQKKTSSTLKEWQVIIFEHNLERKV